MTALTVNMKPSRRLPITYPSAIWARTPFAFATIVKTLHILLEKTLRIFANVYTHTKIYRAQQPKLFFDYVWTIRYVARHREDKFR